jgi:hypothetical protein
MSDKLLSGAALAAAGIAAAGLLSARSAQAASTPTTHVTLYFSAPPAGAGTDPNVVQIPNTSTNFPQGIQGTMDVQIVNFALFVETLEAERYRQTIARLTTGGTDMFGNPISGLGLTANTTSGLDVLLVNGFGQTEMQQRDILATTLYGTSSTGAPINPFLDPTQYLYDFGINNLDRVGAVTGILTAETIGVSAYLGGSGLLAIQSPFLAPAASFLGVEARHAAGVAYALNALNGTTIHTAPLTTDTPNKIGITGGDMPLTADQVLNQGGQVAPGLLPTTNGATPAITGPAGFVYRPS